MIPLGRHEVREPGGRYAGALWVLDSRTEVCATTGWPVTLYLCRHQGQKQTFEVAEAQLRDLIGRTT